MKKMLLKIHILKGNRQMSEVIFLIHFQKSSVPPKKKRKRQDNEEKEKKGNGGKQVYTLTIYWGERLIYM